MESKPTAVFFFGCLRTSTKKKSAHNCSRERSHGHRGSSHTNADISTTPWHPTGVDSPSRERQPVSQTPALSLSSSPKRSPLPDTIGQQCAALFCSFALLPPPRLPPTCPSSIFLSLAHVKALLPEDQILKGTSGARLQAADAGCGGQPHEETRCARKNI